MTLQERIQLMARLGVYMQGTDAGWENTKARAYRENAWFIPEFINRSVDSICTRFLQAPLLEAWVGSYNLPDTPAKVQTVGLVMAGNIPLVGFHDFLCVFLSGHSVLIKASYNDEVLINHQVEKLSQWEPSVSERVAFAEQLKGCDAYIATGSNNSGRYFEYYFGKYPHIIRRNRTSVAVLDGSETRTELEALAEDIQLYFGLGCRNITQLYVPEKYDFIPLLTTLKKYEYLKKERSSLYWLLKKYNFVLYKDFLKLKEYYCINKVTGQMMSKYQIRSTILSIDPLFQKAYDLKEAYRSFNLQLLF